MNPTITMLQSKLPGDDDALKMILEALEKNGNLPDGEYRHLVLLALSIIMIRVKQANETTLQSMFKRRPLVFVACATLIFVVLHEIATAIPIGLLVRSALKALGVPIP